MGAVVVDNDDGAPAYVETGTWSTSGSPGYDGGTYRWTTPGGSETATWTANLADAGEYEVFVWYVPGTNRPTAAKYDIVAADQTYTVYVDQTSGGYAWESLGTFTFNRRRQHGQARRRRNPPTAQRSSPTPSGLDLTAAAL